MAAMSSRTEARTSVLARSAAAYARADAAACSSRGWRAGAGADCWLIRGSWMVAGVCPHGSARAGNFGTVRTKPGIDATRRQLREPNGVQAEDGRRGTGSRTRAPAARDRTAPAAFDTAARACTSDPRGYACEPRTGAAAQGGASRRPVFRRMRSAASSAARMPGVIEHLIWRVEQGAGADLLVLRLASSLAAGLCCAPWTPAPSLPAF